MKTMQKTLLQRHEEYVARAKACGAPTDTLVLPCCQKPLECLIPREAGQQWDTLMTCPYCAGLFVFIATSDGCVGKRP